MQIGSAEVSRGSDKEEDKSRREAVRDTAACLLIQAWMDGGFSTVSPSKGSTCCVLSARRKTIGPNCQFPAENGYLWLDVEETNSRLPQ